MIVTFYSYKGGTGRTMALANIAALLDGGRTVRCTPAAPRQAPLDGQKAPLANFHGHAGGIGRILVRIIVLWLAATIAGSASKCVPNLSGSRRRCWRSVGGAPRAVSRES